MTLAVIFVLALAATAAVLWLALFVYAAVRGFTIGEVLRIMGEANASLKRHRWWRWLP